MSTRSQINIVENGKLIQRIYHHRDGYPQYPGVGSELALTFANKLETFNSQQVIDKLVKDIGDYELTTADHIDIEYLYEIDTVNHTIRCFVMDFCYGMDNNKLKPSMEIDLYNTVISSLREILRDYEGRLTELRTMISTLETEVDAQRAKFNASWEN